MLIVKFDRPQYSSLDASENGESMGGGVGGKNIGTVQLLVFMGRSRILAL